MWNATSPLVAGDAEFFTHQVRSSEDDEDMFDADGEDEDEEEEMDDEEEHVAAPVSKHNLRSAPAPVAREKLASANCEGEDGTQPSVAASLASSIASSSAAVAAALAAARTTGGGAPQVPPTFAETGSRRAKRSLGKRKLFEEETAASPGELLARISGVDAGRASNNNNNGSNNNNNNNGNNNGSGNENSMLRSEYLEDKKLKMTTSPVFSPGPMGRALPFPVKKEPNMMALIASPETEKAVASVLAAFGGGSPFV